MLEKKGKKWDGVPVPNVSVGDSVNVKSPLSKFRVGALVLTGVPSDWIIAKVSEADVK